MLPLINISFMTSVENLVQRLLSFAFFSDLTLYQGETTYIFM